MENFLLLSDLNPSKDLRRLEKLSFFFLKLSSSCLIQHTFGGQLEKAVMSYINNWRGRMMGLLKGRGREKYENMQMFVYSHEWISNECSITKIRDEDMLKRMPVNVTLNTIATSDILEFHCLEASQHINSITPPGEEWEEKCTQIYSFFFFNL